MAESKRGKGIDQWLLSRRNITGEKIRRWMKNNYDHGLGTNAKYLTGAFNDQFSNHDGTFSMLRQEGLESSRNCQRY